MGPVTMISSPSIGSFCSIEVCSLIGGGSGREGSNEGAAIETCDELRKEFSTSIAGKFPSIVCSLIGVGNLSSIKSGSSRWWSALLLWLPYPLLPLITGLSLQERIFRSRGFSSGLICCSTSGFISSWHFFFSNLSSLIQSIFLFFNKLLITNYINGTRCSLRMSHSPSS